MFAYDFNAAASMFANMTDAELADARAANIARRDALDIAAREADTARAAALAALKAAQATYEAAERIARDTERAYSYAADDCCMGANEAYRRAESARATLAALRA